MGMIINVVANASENQYPTAGESPIAGEGSPPAKSSHRLTQILKELSSGKYNQSPRP